MGDVFKNYREESRKNWGRTMPEKEGLTNDEVQYGCLLRIADATEAMAKNHVKLQIDLDWYKSQLQNYKALYECEKNSNRSLKGVITKLKKK